MNDNVTIPKILHHVWLGKQSIHKNLLKCMKSCYDVHSEWKHMFWTDDNLPEMDYFEEEYNVDNNYARKSDLVRLMALYHHGGVYLDTDVECFKPLDKLIEGYKFVVASECGQPHKKDCLRKHINNAILASTKGNEVLSNVLYQVKKNYKTQDMRGDPLSYVSYLAGPDVLNSMWDVFYNDKHTIIYEHEYLYPLHYSEKLPIDKWNIPSNKEEFSEKTHTIHHFAASWYEQK